MRRFMYALAAMANVGCCFLIFATLYILTTKDVLEILVVSLLADIFISLPMYLKVEEVVKQYEEERKMLQRSNN